MNETLSETSPHLAHGTCRRSQALAYWPRLRIVVAGGTAVDSSRDIRRTPVDVPSVISRWKRQDHQPARPLSNRAIAVGVLIVLGIGVTAFTVLWWRYHGGGPRVELDAIRTAGALMAGAGGAIALLLAARRQRSTELTLEHQRLTLEHQREVAAATERGTAEQRITELYTRAIEQLGAEKAPVRLGALHALERLAQTNPAQRQTIIDVICAYLRMPYTPPEDQTPSVDATEDTHRLYEQRRQELQVRLTAQRILSAHLNPGAAAVFWTEIDLNLTEAHLHQFDLTTCHVHTARFDGATFAGYAWFRGAKFTGYAGFVGTKFTGDAKFGRTTFAGDAGFLGATFTGNAGFSGATFTGNAGFRRAKFARDAGFVGATFTEDAEFGEAEFAGVAKFGEVTFTEDAKFNGANFTGTAGFGETEFGGYAWFHGAAFTGDTWFDGATFTKEATFDGATFKKEATFDGATFTGDARFDEATFTGDAKFNEATFTGDAKFNGASFAGDAGFGGAKFAGNPEFDGARVAPNSRGVALPKGWTTRAAQPAGEEDGLYVVHDEGSSDQLAETPGDPRATANNPS